MRDVPSMLRRKKAIPELDFSGRVAVSGARSEFRVGSPVFGTVPSRSHVLSGVGAMAEYIVVPAAYVAAKPDSMSFAEAASLCCLAQTALNMVEKANVTEGDVALVHGGSGGVGVPAVQILKARGVKVVATCSENNMGIV